MPRRLRRCRKQSNLTQENSENNAKYVNIGEKNINTWYTLKEKLHFKCDRDFVEYLLIVVEKYLKSKLDIRLVEEEPELHNPAIPPSNFRQNVDEGESRILSTVDGNSVFVLKKVSDEILALSCKEGTELEVCGTTTIDGKKQSNPPNEKAADELCYEASSTNEEQVRIQYGVEVSEEQEVGIYRNARNKDECYGFVKPKKKRHKFDSKKRIEVYEGLPSLDKTKDDPPVQPLPEDSLVASANFSEPVATAISSITTVKSCLLCDARHSTGDFCPLKSPTRRVHDFIGIAEWRRNDEGDSSYAHASLPECLELRQVEGGLGIFCKVELPQYTEFGPLVASPIKEVEIADDFSMKHIWEVAEGRYLSSEDETKSNWLRWLRPAPIRDSCNIVTIRSADRGGESNSDNCNQAGSGSQLYFLSTVPIKPGDELIFWTQTTGAWASKNMDKTSCGGCNLKFDHSLYYRLHCSIFHEASLSLTVRKYHCKVCGAQVLGKQNIMKHAALYHNGKGAYQCQFCSKYFLRLNYLEMHRNYGCSANPHRARPLCDYCGRKFCQPQKLKVHIKRMHSDMSEVLREFQCSECLKVLGSRAALQRHTKEVHRRPSSNLQQCSKCDKTFQNRSNLKIHMLTHSGIKPFKCQELSCMAAFTTKQCLQFHYRKVHGLSDVQFPRIVRSVEYTFDAYAGHQLLSSDGDSATDIGIEQDRYINELTRLPHESSSSSSVDEDQMHLDTSSNCHTGHSVVEVLDKAPEKWGLEDSGKNVDRDVSDYIQGNNVSSNHTDSRGVVVVSTTPAKASQLVEAALDAAEKDQRIHHMELLSVQEHALMRPLTPIFYNNNPPERVQSPRRRQWEGDDESEHCYTRMVQQHHNPEKMRYDDQHQIDEGLVQNLSLAKRAPLPLPTVPPPPEYLYKYPEERSFQDESVDMSRNGLMYHPPPPPPHHTGFVRYPPAPSSVMYDQHYAASIAHHHTEVLRVISLAHSHSLSVGGRDSSESVVPPFRHHPHMMPPPHPASPPLHSGDRPPAVERLNVEDGYQTSSYPLSSPSYPTSKSPQAVTYHHYAGYY